MMPLYVGPANCVALTGEPWRRVRDRAVELGVRRVRAGRGFLIPATEYVAALERQCDESRDLAGDPRAVVLRALGRISDDSQVP